MNDLRNDPILTAAAHPCKEEPGGLTPRVRARLAESSRFFLDSLVRGAYSRACGNEGASSHALGEVVLLARR